MKKVFWGRLLLVVGLIVVVAAASDHYLTVQEHAFYAAKWPGVTDSWSGGYFEMVKTAYDSVTLSSLRLKIAIGIGLVCVGVYVWPSIRPVQKDAV